jgi:hypothetical protein
MMIGAIKRDDSAVLGDIPTVAVTLPGVSGRDLQA